MKGRKPLNLTEEERKERIRAYQQAYYQTKIKPKLNTEAFKEKTKKMNDSRMADPEYKEIAKQKSRDYYHNVVKPALQLMRALKSANVQV